MRYLYIPLVWDNVIWERYLVVKVFAPYRYPNLVLPLTTWIDKFFKLIACSTHYRSWVGGRGSKERNMVSCFLLSCEFYFGRNRKRKLKKRSLCNLFNTLLDISVAVVSLRPFWVRFSPCLISVDFGNRARTNV